MTSFWQQLAEVAKGQLFSSGHLSASVVTQIARSNATASAACKRKPTQRDHLPWPRLAIPH